MSIRHCLSCGSSNMEIVLVDPSEGMYHVVCCVCGLGYPHGKGHDGAWSEVTKLNTMVHDMREKIETQTYVLKVAQRAISNFVKSYDEIKP